MDIYKSKKGISFIIILSVILLIDICGILLKNLINQYMVLSLIQVALVVLNIYGCYYWFLSLSLKYIIDEDYLHIVGVFGFKNIKISFKEIESYKICTNRVKGVKLRGIGDGRFAFGRYFIEKIGTTRMFVTSNKNTVYLKTKDINYAVSPEEIELFIKKLKEKGVNSLEWEYVRGKPVILYKEKAFMVPFIIVSILIIIFTITPLIFYVKGMLPEKMPLSLDATFNPIRMGTGKQYAFKQAIYGVLNMGILLCMYYAAHFHAKYDKKSAKTYIYVALFTAIVFFLMQMRTLFNYML
ncbi:PH domain-containing protein [Clostridium botulinum]|uniref:Membrane protein n=1 Tax=Clostridium botulinum TaxID=1491 RepID=A0A9Q1UZ61_CLOBO|nr:PH domain-containing protein [Clostridium botulinum]KEH97488.1 membrane protein [Clostridium botulinum D str. 16868]KEI03439.1 membrane protein [Clostridium botulinum C/D str. Sp77]KLU76132.1 membrane protein [Clostridium botulinum V891]KOA74065.1 membrane protein [Clostridium botulinum]KOA75443.1 membrane protein [Clostridium botulinum]